MAETKDPDVCYVCGYVVTPDGPAVTVCPGCGSSGTFAPQHIETAGLGEGQKAGTFDHAVEAAEKAAKSKQ